MVLCSLNLIPNAFRNIGLLEETLVCTKEMLNAEVNHLRDMGGLFDFVIDIIRQIKDFCSDVQRSLSALKYFLVEVLDFLKEAITIIKFVFNLCNDSFGRPFNMCILAITDRLGQCFDDHAGQYSAIYMYPLCGVSYLGMAMCHILNHVQIVCKTFKLLFRFIHEFFYLILFDHWGDYMMAKIDALSNEFKFSLNASRLYSFTSESNMNLKRVRLLFYPSVL
jgi:hypothetical protein